MTQTSTQVEAPRPPFDIPFNRPAVGPTALDKLRQVTESGHHSGDGAMTRAASDILRALHPDSAAVLLTSSCTHALELSALVLDIQPGDEVIVPSFTFVSTANAFALRGATIRFADISPVTLGLDPAQVAHMITDHTRAIVPVHYAGVSCDIESIVALGNDVGAHVIEDNAHGLFGDGNGKRLGTFGALSTLSFHETKNVSSGEGGALVINDPALVERAEIAREKGTNRSLFFRGMVDKYTWVGLGSSWLPSEFTAAILLAALEHSDVTQARRHSIWARYHSGLSSWAASQSIQLPTPPTGSVHPAHLFHLLLPDLDTRTRFIKEAALAGVQTVFHYVPLHSSPFGRRVSQGAATCPVTDDVSARLVRLPLFADLDDAQCDRVLETVCAFEC